MRKEELSHNLPWLPLGPTEEVMRRIEQHISTNRGDFYSIYGPSGCGKTRFMMELSRRLDLHENIVAREIVAGNDSIFKQVAKLLETSEDEAEIVAKLEAVPPTGIKMVLLVDDADKLTQDELSFLYRTKEKINNRGRFKQTHIVVVLLMDLNNQDIFSKGLLLHSNSFTIGPVNHMQVSELVTHIYKHYGKEHQYSLSDLRQLHAFSYGYPGRVIRLIAPDLEPSFEFKKRHVLYGLLGLLGIVAVVLAIMNYDSIAEYFGLTEKKIDPVSEIMISSQVTPIYYPALDQLIEEATERYESIPKGIVIMQGGFAPLEAPTLISTPDVSAESAESDLGSEIKIDSQDKDTSSQN